MQQSHSTIIMDDVTTEFAAHWIQKNRGGLLKLIDNEYPKSMRVQQFFGIESWLRSYGKKWYVSWSSRMP
jgi:hypothetical protein